MKKWLAFCITCIMLMTLSVSAFAVAPEIVANGNNYSTVQAAIAANGSATYYVYGRINVPNGGFTGAGSSTFIGKTEDAELVIDPPYEGSYGSVGNITFQDLIFTTNDQNYKGFKDSASETFINCTINGAYWTYTPKVKFSGCTFYQDDNNYCIWQYNQSEMTVENCKFYSPHKFILIYSDQSNFTLKANINNNQFLYQNIAANREKAAIEMNGYWSNKVILNASGNMLDCRFTERGLAYDKTHAENPNYGGTVTISAANTTVVHEYDDCGHPVPVAPVVPAAPSKSVPKTGDNSTLLLWGLLMTLSFVGMVMMGKKRQNAVRK